MSLWSLSAFERLTNIQICDVVGESEPEGNDAGAELLACIDLNELEAFLAEEERKQRARVYNSEELAPRLWPVRGYEADGSGYPVTPNIVHPKAVCSALLYAHRVEIPDPLLSALRNDWPRYSQPAWEIQKALWVLDKLRPLIKDGLVTVGHGLAPESSARADEFINAALRRARGRAAYLDLLHVPQDVATDLIGSDADSAPQSRLAFRRSGTGASAIFLKRRWQASEVSKYTRCSLRCYTVTPIYG